MAKIPNGMPVEFVGVGSVLAQVSMQKLIDELNENTIPSNAHYGVDQKGEFYLNPDLKNPKRIYIKKKRK